MISNWNDMDKASGLSALAYSDMPDSAAILTRCCIMANLDGRFFGTALRAYALLHAGRSLPASHDERQSMLGITRGLYMRHRHAYDQALAIARELAQHLTPVQTHTPGQMNSPTDKPDEIPQSHASKGVAPIAGVAPLFTRVGFIKPENLSIKPAVEKEAPQTVDVSELWPLFDDARKREGVPLVGSLDRAGNVRFRAIKARVVRICQGQRPKVAAFIGRIIAHARARGYGGQLARLIARWNELERLAKADLGIGARQGARGARRASCETGGVHLSHVARPLPAAPPPSTTPSATARGLLAGLLSIAKTAPRRLAPT
jgi:hypothetical protein